MKLLELLEFGGKGSGDYGHSGRPGERGGSGAGVKNQDRSNRAKETYHLRLGNGHIKKTDENQNNLARAMKTSGTTHLAAFDIVHSNIKLGIEVKTLIDQKNDKVTMHPHSIRRKLGEAKTLGLKNVATVVFDNRPGKNQLYYRMGLGSFRVSSLTPVKNVNELASILDTNSKKMKMGKDYTLPKLKR